jgi:hypothetical protein
MRVFIILSILAVLAVLHDPASAQSMLRDGEYEIEVSLELPFVIDTSTRKVEHACLGGSISQTMGLAVLSDNNPLARCPITDERTSPNTLSFEVACPGVNAARGHAAYQLWGDTFRGRIEMKMGGKNMTMTEVQTGRRIGDCTQEGTQ